MKSKSCCSQWPAEEGIKVIRRAVFLPMMVFLCWALAPGAALRRGRSAMDACAGERAVAAAR